MLGAAALGATWTSCSPDFGARAVADRFGQVAPKVLFVSDGFVSAGKTTSVIDKVEDLVNALPSVLKVVVIPTSGEAFDASKFSSELQDKVVAWDAFLGAEDAEETYEPMPFTHPQFVLYSSGSKAVWKTSTGVSTSGTPSSSKSFSMSAASAASGIPSSSLSGSPSAASPLPSRPRPSSPTDCWRWCP